jgi:hypothetical protein
MAEKQPSAPEDAPLPRVSQRWMRWVLVVAAVLGLPGGFIYYRYHEQYERDPPKLDICFAAYGSRLRRPIIVAPSEPYTLTDGQTFYLTDAQSRAAGCAASRLPGDASQKLVKTWAIEDQAEQAAALGKLVLDVPADPSHDREAFGLWRLVSGSLESLDKSEARDAIKKDVDQAIACRFKHPQLPDCPSRPPFPTYAAVLAAIGTAGLLAVLGGLAVGGIRRLLGRRAQKRAAAASATVAAS